MSGERKNGFVYPLFLHSALNIFGNDKIVIENDCNKSGNKSCPSNYKKVIKNPNGEEPEKSEKKEEEGIKENKISIPANVTEPTTA